MSFETDKINFQEKISSFEALTELKTLATSAGDEAALIEAARKEQSDAVADLKGAKGSAQDRYDSGAKINNFGDRLNQEANLTMASIRENITQGRESQFMINQAATALLSQIQEKLAAATDQVSIDAILKDIKDLAEDPALAADLKLYTELSAEAARILRDKEKGDARSVWENASKKLTEARALLEKNSRLAYAIAASEIASGKAASSSMLVAAGDGVAFNGAGATTPEAQLAVLKARVEVLQKARSDEAEFLDGEFVRLEVRAIDNLLARGAKPWTPKIAVTSNPAKKGTETDADKPDPDKGVTDTPPPGPGGPAKPPGGGTPARRTASPQPEGFDPFRGLVIQDHTKAGFGFHNNMPLQVKSDEGALVMEVKAGSIFFGTAVKRNSKITRVGDTVITDAQSFRAAITAKKGRLVTVSGDGFSIEVQL